MSWLLRSNILAHREFAVSVIRGRAKTRLVYRFGELDTTDRRSVELPGNSGRPISVPGVIRLDLYYLLASSVRSSP